MIISKKFLIFLFVFIFSNFQLIAEITEETVEENVKQALPEQKKFQRNSPVYSPEKVRNAENCKSSGESYSLFVFKAEGLINKGQNKQAANLLQKHLRCWNDLPVYALLAKLYESDQKYFLAALAYKNAGMTDKYNEIEKLRMRNSSGGNFEKLVLEKTRKYENKSNAERTAGAVMIVLGGVAASAGLGLFIHQKGYSGSNSVFAQYSLMIGGLSVMGGGITLDYFAQRHDMIAQAFSDISRYNDSGTTPDEFYVFSGIKDKTKKKSASTLSMHGLSLIALSMPLFAVAIYSFFDQNVNNGFLSPIQMYSVLPGVAALASGIAMVSVASKWDNLNNRNSLFTLNHISPTANPVTKTYGISAGFSF